MNDWHHTRAGILRRDHFICAYCCDDANEVDHIVPRSKGGSDDPSNLVCACKHCNAAKGARTPWQWHLEPGVILPPWWVKETAR
jgi:5-methylcytosine-specific restriction endonuclease McrA